MLVEAEKLSEESPTEASLKNYIKEYIEMERRKIQNFEMYKARRRIGKSEFASKYAIGFDKDGVPEEEINLPF